MMVIEDLCANPRTLKSSSEVEDILSRIRAYEAQEACTAGVIAIQNRMTGGHYRIVCEDEAARWLAIPNTADNHERAFRYYPKSYFEALVNQIVQQDKRA